MLHRRLDEAQTVVPPFSVKPLWKDPQHALREVPLLGGSCPSGAARSFPGSRLVLGHEADAATVHDDDLFQRLRASSVGLPSCRQRHRMQRR